MNLRIQTQAVTGQRDQLDHQRAALEQTMLAERQRAKEAEEAFLAQLQLKSMIAEQDCTLAPSPLAFRQHGLFQRRALVIQLIPWPVTAWVWMRRFICCSSSAALAFGIPIAPGGRALPIRPRAGATPFPGHGLGVPRR